MTAHKKKRLSEYHLVISMNARSQNLLNHKLNTYHKNKIAPSQSEGIHILKPVSR